MTVKYFILSLTLLVLPLDAATPAHKAASTYQQAIAQDKIKLRSVTDPKKQLKINATQPLGNIVRPSIKAKLFQQQQYQKSSLTIKKLPKINPKNN